MSMMKKLFILALAAVMTLSAITFSACGKNEEQETESEVSVSESTDDEAETYATETSSNSTEPSSATSSTEQATNSTQATNTTTSKEKQTNTNTNTNTSRSSNGSRSTNRTTSSSGNTAVTSVSLSKGNMTVNVGSSASFEVYINPESATDRQFNVTTSNGNATVSCNRSTVTVYGKNKGNCTITVSSTNGKSAECDVTVTKKSSSGGSSSGSGGNSSGGNNKNSGGNSGAVNDNTPLTHKQICTDKVMGRVCEAVNNYFKKKGMTYDSSKNINNSGWFLSGSNYYKSDNVYSINRIIKEETEGFDNELYGYYMSNPQDDISKMYSGRFRCYYVRESNGEYSIYFCH